MVGAVKVAKEALHNNLTCIGENSISMLNKTNNILPLTPIQTK